MSSHTGIAPTAMPWQARASGGVAIGILLLAIGLWVLWGGRQARGEGKSPEDRSASKGILKSGWLARPATFREKLTNPTKLVVGMSFLLLGYHIAAWLCPPWWFGIKVPAERWWMLVVGVVAAIAGSLLNDRVLVSLERRHDRREGK